MYIYNQYNQRERERETDRVKRFLFNRIVCYESSRSSRGRSRCCCCQFVLRRNKNIFSKPSLPWDNLPPFLYHSSLEMSNSFSHTSDSFQMKTLSLPLFLSFFLSILSHTILRIFFDKYHFVNQSGRAQAQSSTTC